MKKQACILFVFVLVIVFSSTAGAVPERCLNESIKDNHDPYSLDHFVADILDTDHANVAGTICKYNDFKFMYFSAHPKPWNIDHNLKLYWNSLFYKSLYTIVPYPPWESLDMLPDMQKITPYSDEELLCGVDIQDDDQAAFKDEEITLVNMTFTVSSISGGDHSATITAEEIQAYLDSNSLDRRFGCFRMKDNCSESNSSSDILFWRCWAPIPRGLLAQYNITPKRTDKVECALTVKDVCNATVSPKQEAYVAKYVVHFFPDANSADILRPSRGVVREWNYFVEDLEVNTLKTRRSGYSQVEALPPEASRGPPNYVTEADIRKRLGKALWYNKGANGPINTDEVIRVFQQFGGGNFSFFNSAGLLRELKKHYELPSKGAMREGGLHGQVDKYLDKYVLVSKSVIEAYSVTFTPAGGFTQFMAFYIVELQYPFLPPERGFLSHEMGHAYAALCDEYNATYYSEQAKSFPIKVFKDQDSFKPDKDLIFCPNILGDPPYGSFGPDGWSIMGNTVVPGSIEYGYPIGRHCPVGNCKGDGSDNQVDTSDITDECCERCKNQLPSATGWHGCVPDANSCSAFNGTLSDINPCLTHSEHKYCCCNETLPQE